MAGGLPSLRWKLQTIDPLFRGLISVRQHNTSKRKCGARDETKHFESVNLVPTLCKLILYFPFLNCQSSNDESCCCTCM